MLRTPVVILLGILSAGPAVAGSCGNRGCGAPAQTAPAFAAHNGGSAAQWNRYYQRNYDPNFLPGSSTPIGQPAPGAGASAPRPSAPPRMPDAWHVTTPQSFGNGLFDR